MAIAIDLDGTLATYYGWEGTGVIGDIVPSIKKLIFDLIDEGEEVEIFTARADDLNEVLAIKKWLKENKLPNLEITNIKKKKFKKFYDDRAITVMKNTGVILTKEDQGSHYRYEYKGIKLDPARILMIYNQNDPLLGAIVKKSLCAGNRGHKNFEQDLKDIICAAERRLEMLREDDENFS